MPPKKTSKKRLMEGSKYSKADVMSLKDIFEKHDADHNGRVTVGELVAALESEHQLTHQELSAFRTMDLNKDGVLTFNEYLRRLYPLATDKEFAKMLGWVAPEVPLDQREQTFNPDAQQLEEIKRMFVMFDKNKNGTIDKQELAAVAESCGYEPGDIKYLLESSDTDKNGAISFEEFVQLMKVSYM